VLPVQSVALVITTLCSFSNKYRFNPSATFTGAACSATRLGVRPLTSIQYTASGIDCFKMASTTSAKFATFVAAAVSSDTVIAPARQITRSARA